MGADVCLSSRGNLDIQARYPMPDDQWQRILNLARENKPEIIQDLKIEHDLNKLLWQIGAKIEPGPRLVFNPLLDGPKVDRERWDKAVELEGMFWEAYSKGMI